MVDAHLGYVYIGGSKLVWYVATEGGVLVQVDAHSGRALRIINETEPSYEQPETAPHLSDRQLLTKAAEILNRSGFRKLATLGPPERKFPGGPTGSICYIDFPRSCKGIPFDQVTEGQGAHVNLKAADGKLLDLFVNLSAPDPVSTAVRIDQATAKKLAKVGPNTTANLRVVMPNSYWVRRGLGRSENASVSRVAWVVRYEYADEIACMRPPRPPSSNLSLRRRQEGTRGGGKGPAAGDALQGLLDRCRERAGVGRNAVSVRGVLPNP